MEPAQPGHFRKTRFIWEPGCPEPAAVSALSFVDAEDAWLGGALAEVMSQSLDGSDQYAVAHGGAVQAVEELLALVPQSFEKPANWWRAATDESGRKVGFVLPVIFQDQARWKDGCLQGTILHTGVLHGFRGRGCAGTLLDEATRVFIRARCWRIFCDASTANAPMINAFRRAGYKERTPWQPPLA